MRPPTLTDTFKCHTRTGIRPNLEIKLVYKSPSTFGTPETPALHRRSLSISFCRSSHLRKDARLVKQRTKNNNTKTTVPRASKPSANFKGEEAIMSRLVVCSCSHVFLPVTKTIPIAVTRTAWVAGAVARTADCLLVELRLCFRGVYPAVGAIFAENVCVATSSRKPQSGE